MSQPVTCFRCINLSSNVSLAKESFLRKWGWRNRLNWLTRKTIDLCGRPLLSCARPTMFDQTAVWLAGVASKVGWASVLRHIRGAATTITKSIVSVQWKQVSAGEQQEHSLRSPSSSSIKVFQHNYTFHSVHLVVQYTIWPQNSTLNIWLIRQISKYSIYLFFFLSKTIHFNFKRNI